MKALRKSIMFKSDTDSEDEEYHANEESQEAKNQRKVDEFQKRLDDIDAEAGFTVRPEAPYMQAWDILMLLLLGYTALLMPFEMGFLEGRYFLVLEVSNRFVDILFILDMVVSCHLTFYDETSGRVISDQKEIRNRYCKTWFPIDLSASLPFGLIGKIQGAENYQTTLQILRLFRVLKLLRLVRVGRIIGRWQSKIGYRYTRYTLTWCLIGLLTLAHWGACAWGISTTFVSDNNWKIENGKSDEDAVHIYICALYWSMMTLTTIGYGDYGPANNVERTLGTVFCMFGGLFYAYIIGTLCGTLIEVNLAGNEYNTRRDMMNEFISGISLEKSERLKVRTYFRKKIGQFRRINQQKALHQLSPGLQNKLLKFQFKDSFRTFSIWQPRIVSSKITEPDEAERLQKIYDEEADKFVISLLSYLKFDSFPQRECIVSPGDLVGDMYMVNRGIMACEGKLVTCGSGVGEDIILYLINKKASRCYYLQTLTFVEVFTLNKVDLWLALEGGKKFPNMFRTLRKKAIKMGFCQACKKAVRKSRTDEWKKSRRSGRSHSTHSGQKKKKNIN